MDRAEGVGGGDQLNELGAVTDGPLGPKGAGQCRPKCEGLAGAVEVEDRGEGGKSSRESKRRAKTERVAPRERSTRSSHGQTRHKKTVRTGPVRTEPVRTEPVRTEPVRT
jgi:hypothetical protein